MMNPDDRKCKMSHKITCILFDGIQHSTDVYHTLYISYFTFWSLELMKTPSDEFHAKK